MDTAQQSRVRVPIYELATVVGLNGPRPELILGERGGRFQTPEEPLSWTNTEALHVLPS